jgi:hypothetical protein
MASLDYRALAKAAIYDAVLRGETISVARLSAATSLSAHSKWSFVLNPISETETAKNEGHDPTLAVVRSDTDLRPYFSDVPASEPAGTHSLSADRVEEYLRRREAMFAYFKNKQEPLSCDRAEADQARETSAA